MSLVNTENILNLLFSYNPWWQTGIMKKEFDKPMRRFAFYEAEHVLMHPDIRRTVILCGARRTGKTTVMYQLINMLLENGVSPKNILFVSFDHPLLKLCSIDKVMDVYRTNVSAEEKSYCFFDEIQYTSDWNNWLKILYDTNPNIKIVATGSASPMISDKISESGLGRWKIVHVPTLSFFEYCELLNIKVPNLPANIKPTKMYLRSQQEQTDIFNKLSMLQVHFIRYLQVGGFPELALSSDDIYAQRTLREDIVDKALKRDLPSIYGIRNINDIEKYRQKSLYVTRKNAVRLQKDEYFIADLIGLKVQDEDGKELGTVKDVIETGANDVYEVEMADGRSLLLPAIKQCILNVDVENGTMQVHVLEGLLDL